MPPPVELRNRPQDGISWTQKVAVVELEFWLCLQSIGGTWIYIGGRSTTVELRGAHEAGGVPTPLWHAGHPCGPPIAPPTYSLLLYITTHPPPIRIGAKTLIPPPQFSVSTRSHLGAYSGAPPEGALLPLDHYVGFPRRGEDDAVK